MIIFEQFVKCNGSVLMICGQTSAGAFGEGGVIDRAYWLLYDGKVRDSR